MVRTTPAKVLLTTTLQPFVVQLSGSLIARQGSAARHPDPGMPAGPSSRVRRPAACGARQPLAHRRGWGWSRARGDR